MNSFQRQTFFAGSLLVGLLLLAALLALGVRRQWWASDLFLIAQFVVYVPVVVGAVGTIWQGWGKCFGTVLSQGREVKGSLRFLSGALNAVSGVLLMCGLIYSIHIWNPPAELLQRPMFPGLLHRLWGPAWLAEVLLLALGAQIAAGGIALLLSRPSRVMKDTQ